MQKILLFTLACFCACLTGFTQTKNLDSMINVRKFHRDSSMRAAIHADSLKFQSEFNEAAKGDSLTARLIYPAIYAGDWSGVIPVKDITEVPDPDIDYKILFELTFLNPDSLAKDVNYGLTEVARVINLHVASGVPLKRIKPIIVVHAAALKAFGTNAYYKEKFKTDNPNLKVVEELKKFGTRFIACGQAMNFMDVKKEDMIPDMKISITAQTVISHYQLKGYLLWWGGAGQH